MTLLDRLFTILVTATLTSAAWIVFGGSLVEYAPEAGEREEAVDAPAARPDDAGEAEPAAASLDTEDTAPPTQVARGELIVPVLGVAPDELRDSFSDKRGDGERLHEAIDIMADAGTSVVAAAPGTIERLFLSDAGGRTIYVRSDDGETIYYYAHLRDYAEGLREGQKVRRGQRLGTVGSSGNADPSAPHLHFALLRTTPSSKWWEPAVAVNPIEMLGGTRGNRAEPID